MAKRPPSSLKSVEFSKEQAELILDRIGDALRFHISNIDLSEPLTKQIQAIAMDAYMQGLLDGQQIPKVDGVEQLEKQKVIRKRSKE